MPRGVYIRTKEARDNIGKAHRKNRICSVEGCNNKHSAKGLCQKHYDKQQHRKYYLNNKKQVNKQNKQWQEDNKEQIKQYLKDNKKHIAKRNKKYDQKREEHKKQYYLDNKKRITKKKKLYRQTLNSKIRQAVYRHNRRALTKDLTVATIQQVYEDNIKTFGTLTCCLCFKWIIFGDESLEHLTPLSRGGSNKYDNLGIAHRKCNKKKGTKTLTEWFNNKKEKGKC